MSVGPKKIVLIRSGKYDYGEIEFVGSVQIVGPNNTGKTTLINTLQFLYIDDLRRMDFGSYTPEQTREYYFPNQYSYLLFECLGTRGECVIGWRGQSKASGGEPERFCYQGPYDSIDFINEKDQVREPRDISARLALKEFRQIKSAQEHREILLPASNSQDRGLGIVLLRESEKYHHFREILKNLLTLSTIEQTQMRDRVLMLAEIPPDRVALDARDLFGKDYDRIRERRDKLRKFKQHQSLVQMLVSRFGEQEKIRGELTFRWQDLRVKQRVFEEDHSKIIQKLKETVLEQKRRQQLFSEELIERQTNLANGLKSEGALQGQLSQIKIQEREFADFVEDFERAALAQLGQRIKTLDQQLGSAETESRERAQQKLQAHREWAAQKERTINRFDEVLVTELRKQFKDEEIESLFRLMNRELLEYPLGAEGVEILNIEALKRRVDQLLLKFEGLRYRDDSLAIRFVNSPGTMSKIPNVQSLKQELAEQVAEVKRWESILKSIEQRDSLGAERKAAAEEHDKKAKRLFLFEELQRKRAEKPRVEQEFKTVKAAIEAVNKRIAELNTDLKQAERSEHNALGSIRKAEDEFNAVMGRYGQCVPPEFATVVVPSEAVPNDFDAAISLYLRQQEREERLRSEVENTLRQLEAFFGDEFVGADQKETIGILQSELEALAEKEEALARDWNAHIHGLKATFERVLKELMHVRSAVDDLNRQLAKVTVSNLKQLRMEVLEQGDVVGWLRKLAEIEQPGLFDDDTRLEPTLRNFRQRIEANPVTRYADLFSLGFTVVGADDRKHTYHDFKQIESHGTTITIKVLFNLLVLKSQMRSGACHVPFFLDEIQALDPANRSAILMTAQKLGFVAITAAPDSVSEVNYLYFLQPEKGRIVLRNKHHIGIKRTTLA